MWCRSIPKEKIPTEGCWRVPGTLREWLQILGVKDIDAAEKKVRKIGPFNQWKETRGSCGGRARYERGGSWREGDRTPNVHLGSCKKMDAEAARRKPGKMKAERLADDAD